MQALLARVQDEREALRTEIDAVPQALDELRRRRVQAQAKLDTRATRRAAKATLRLADREEARLQGVASRARLQRFERRVVPFMRAQNELLAEAQQRHDDAMATSQRLPGGRKRIRLDTAGSWASQATQQDGTVVRAFMTELQGLPCRVQPEASDVCAECGGRMLMNDRKATMCCNECGRSAPHIDLTICSSAQRGDVEFVSQTYKRSNHFLEWLNQCQAKESTRVGDDVLVRVMQELYDRGLRRNSEVTSTSVRAALKQLRLRQQYEHVCQITCRINGEPPPRLLPVVEERLRLMFLAVQAPFERVKGKRKNFLSYAYTLTQFLALLGADLSPVRNFGFTLLKGKDKLDKQNVIYEKICAQLNWQFSPVAHTG